MTKNILTILFSVSCILCVSRASAQQEKAVGLFQQVPGSVLIKNVKMMRTDSGTFYGYRLPLKCKGNLSSLIAADDDQQTPAFAEKTVMIIPPAKKVSFIQVHGNVSYEYFYRSKIDTPFNQTDLQQHTERVSLEILLKEKYPLRVSFASRQSNSPFFRNFLDFNAGFDKYAYNRNLKKVMIDKINRNLPGSDLLKSAEAALKKEMSKLENLKRYVKDPGTLQKIIEAREREYRKKNISGTLPKKNMNGGFSDSLTAKKERILNNKTVKAVDSTAKSLVAAYEQKKKELAEAQERVDMLRKKTDSIRAAAQKDIAAVKDKINKARDAKELKKIAAENGILPDKENKWADRLSYVKTFNIGRSIVDYTELTAQNIIITGVNVEYNPRLYAAFAAGKINYRFRDFFNRKQSGNNQYLALGRLGWGNKEGRAVIFTFFKGRKDQSEFSSSNSVNRNVDITGYSVETIWKKDENTFLSAEYAKSTKPYSGNSNGNRGKESLLSFSDRTNTGINIKGQTVFTKTDTRISGFFRKTGENFQSFSLFSYNTDQTAWLARADQSFWKRKIGVTAMLRRNDFINPFTEKTFKTSTIFKTVLLNVRIPKYPVLSVGYYPGSQLYIVNKDLIRENAYYIINGSAVYSYYIKHTGMNTSFVYNRYINKASDSGFVLYKGVNYYAAQTLFIRRLQLQGGYAYNKQPELNYYTLESNADYSLKKIFRFGAGIKLSEVAGGSNYAGGRLSVGIDTKLLGSFRLQYEKSYLPTLTQTLYPVETGRISWYKNF